MLKQRIAPKLLSCKKASFVNQARALVVTSLKLSRDNRLGFRVKVSLLFMGKKFFTERV